MLAICICHVLCPCVAEVVAHWGILSHLGHFTGFRATGFHVSGRAFAWCLVMLCWLMCFLSHVPMLHSHFCPSWSRVIRSSISHSVFTLLIGFALFVCVSAFSFSVSFFGVCFLRQFLPVWYWGFLVCIFVCLLLVLYSLGFLAVSGFWFFIAPPYAPL